MTDHAFEIDGAERPGPWLVSCDHATNLVPDWVGGGALGIDPADMARHIAYDIGAAGLARALGKALNAPVVLTRFSRLVIDPNRGEDDPTLVMRLYDGTVIEANRRITAADRARRLAELYRPYHAAMAALLEARPERALLAVHSFTRQLRGREERPWQVGILHADADGRLAVPLIARLRREPDLSVGDNQPYVGHLPGDSVDRHALATGRPNVLIELRNDLIEEAPEQRAWAARLAPILDDVRKEAAV